MATGSNLTDAFSDQILNTARATTLTSWTPFASLFTTQTTDAGGGTEVTGTAYIREAVTWGAPAASSPSGRIVTNTAAVQYATAGSNWGTVIAFGIHTLVTAGQMNLWGTLAFPVTINTGQTRAFDVNDLSWLLD